MAKANYNYTVKDGIVAIVDLDLGGMSVTNDIENVVKEISKKENIQAAEYKWIYKDSDGMWDGFNPVSETFIHLQIHLESDARAKIAYKK